MKKAILLSLLSVSTVAAVVLSSNSNDQFEVIKAEEVSKSLTFDKDHLSVTSDVGNTFYVNYDYPSIKDNPECPEALGVLGQNGFSINGDNYSFNKIKSIIIELYPYNAEGGGITCALSKTNSFISNAEDVEMYESEGLFGEHSTITSYTFDYSSSEQAGGYHIQIWSTLFFYDSSSGTVKSHYCTPIKALTVNYVC